MGKRARSEIGVGDEKDRNRASYGDRYYTQPNLLRALVVPQMEKMMEQMDPAPSMFFDFCAGNDALQQALAASPHPAVANLKYTGMDIAPAAGSRVTQGDFLAFTEHAQHCKCIVGFNPPFGRGGTLASRFVREAFRFDPAGFVLILPLRPWAFHGFRVVHREILPENAFFLPDTGTAPGTETCFDTASVLLLLVRDWSVRASDLRVSENGLVPGAVHGRVTAEDCESVRWPQEGGGGEEAHVLLVRKVGHYAGQQIYCLQALSGGKVGAVYIGHDGSVSALEEVELPSLDKLFEASKTPWGRRVHVVCNLDPAPAYGGSNPSGTQQNKRRVGTGFLKCAVQGHPTMPQLVELGQHIRTTVVKFQLAKGSPKSINKGIVESIAQLQ